MNYELVIFDADETLLDFEKAEEFAFEKAMKHFNIQYDRENHLKNYHEINKAVWSEFEKELITAEDLKVERFKRLFHRLNIDLDPVEVNNQYMNNLCSACFILDGAIEILEELHGKVKLALITNGLLKVQDGRIRKSHIAKYFEAIVISEEAGVAKPNPKIFEYTLKELGHTNKGTVLMIGDSLNSDIKGGVNFGIDTCWFNPKKLENNSGLKPTYEIKELNELVNLILK